METWDGVYYGPLEVTEAARRLVRLGGDVFRLGRTEFTILLRLITCRGGVVSHSMLACGLRSDYAIRFAIHRLRKRLLKHIGDSIVIEHVRQYGYKLSLAGG